MTAQPPLPDNNDVLVDATAQRVSDVVYKRLCADILMLDDMLVTEDELAEILKQNPEVVRTWARIQFGPSFVRIAGSRKRHYRIGAVRQSEVRAGASHVKALIELQNEFDLRTTGRIEGDE